MRADKRCYLLESETTPRTDHIYGQQDSWQEIRNPTYSTEITVENKMKNFVVDARKYLLPYVNKSRENNYFLVDKN